VASALLCGDEDQEDTIPMTKTQARALASAINQEYPDVQAVAIGLRQDHWGVRVIHNRLGAVPDWDVFERAYAAQRIYPTPYGEMLAKDERGRRLAS
jgi:hypothetical protein